MNKAGFFLRYCLVDVQVFLFFFFPFIIIYLFSPAGRILRQNRVTREQKRLAFAGDAGDTVNVLECSGKLRRRVKF